MIVGSTHSFEMRSDFNEIINNRIINQLKENLQNHNFCFKTNHHQITRDFIFIKKFVRQLNELRVFADGFNSNYMEEIKNTLSNSNIKVSFVS